MDLETLWIHKLVTRAKWNYVSIIRRCATASDFFLCLNLAYFYMDAYAAFVTLVHGCQRGIWKPGTVWTSFQYCINTCKFPHTNQIAPAFFESLFDLLEQSRPYESEITYLQHDRKECQRYCKEHKCALKAYIHRKVQRHWSIVMAAVVAKMMWNSWLQSNLEPGSKFVAKKAKQWYDTTRSLRSCNEL